MVFRRTDDAEGARFFRSGRDREDSPEDAGYAADSADLDSSGATPPASSLPPRPPTELGAPPRSGLGQGPLGSGPPFPSVARGEIETVVGAESSFDGKLRSEHSIRVQGEARGEIESKQAVYVEEGARVSAKITAAEITIAGQVEGQLFSVGRVEIRPSGQVNGEINAASLVMQEGAFFDGQLKMKNRGRPDESPAVDRDASTSTADRRLPSLGPSTPMRGGLAD